MAALTIQSFPTDERQFHRLPSLISGPDSAILIDGPFLRSSGEAIRDAILASGKRLEAILITCHDPDFYFGLTPIRAAFPDIPVIAPPPIAQVIRETAAQKVDFWSREHGDEIPPLDAVVFPDAFGGTSLALDGETIEIVTTPQDGFFHLWLPAQRIIVGGVQVSSGNHIWMADFTERHQRDSWIASLNTMLAMDPVDVLPGHLPPGAPTGIEAVRFTIDYIRVFEEELARAANGAALIAAMMAHYPDAAMPFILDLGARVCMGEQQWP